MKKFIIFALTLVLIASMTVNAYAFTPKIVIPHIDMPDIHAEDIEVEVSESFWDKWFAEHPIKISFTAPVLG